TTTLYRPVGQAELDLIAATGHRRFPPRLPEQPIFYPVCNEEYAVQIASRWNTAQGKVGYVTRFAVRSDFLAKYDVHIVGSRIRAEGSPDASSGMTVDSEVMSMLKPNVDEITAPDIDALVQAQAPESATLDFKLTLTTDRDEFLKDISSFANGLG